MIRMKVHQFPNRTIEINQETFLYFGGTAYLGLPTLPEFQEIIFKNIHLLNLLLRFSSKYYKSY